jgi:hypothetical protein
MKHHINPYRPHRFVIIALLIASLFVLAACGGGETEPTATPEPTAEPTAEPATAPTEAMVEPTADTGETEPVATDTSGTTDGTTGSVDPISPMEGLDQLDSYHAMLTIAVEGTDDAGEPQSGSINMELARDNIAEDTHTRVQMEGSIFSGDEDLDMSEVDLEGFQIDGTSYALMTFPGEDPQCLKSTTANDSFPDMEDFVGDVENAELIEEGVEVNGVMTDHYSIANAAEVLEAEQDENVTINKADVWIAQDGNYLVKMEIEAQTTGLPMEDMSGDLSEATVSFTYDLTDINAVSITLPEACENAVEINEEMFNP